MSSTASAPTDVSSNSDHPNNTNNNTSNTVSGPAAYESDFVLRRNATFQQRYDRLPAQYKVVPDSIRLVERELCRKTDDGSRPNSMIIQAQATNSWGVFLPSITIRRRYDNDWSIDANIAGRSVHTAGPSIDQVYAVFAYEFGRWHMCQSCESTHLEETCLDCELREALSAPQTCGICMMERKDMYRLQCGHTNYCRPCLKRVSPRRCPSCREPFALDRGFVERNRKRRRCDCDDGDHDDDDNDDDDRAEEEEEEEEE